jgi:hypothetical protein
MYIDVYAQTSMGVEGYGTFLLIQGEKAVLNAIFKGVLETANFLSKAREYFAEDDNYTPLFPEEVSLNSSSVKIGRGLLSPPEMGLGYFLMGAQVADLQNEEEMCYEFFVEVK